MNRLSERGRRFAEHYVKPECRNCAEAYVAAGYVSAEQAEKMTHYELQVRGKSVLAQKGVSEYINRLNEEIAERVTASIAREDFSFAMDQAAIRRKLEILANADTHRVAYVEGKRVLVEIAKDVASTEIQGYQRNALGAVRELVSIEGMVTHKMEHSFSGTVWVEFFCRAMAEHDGKPMSQALSTEIVANVLRQAAEESRTGSIADSLGKA